MFNNHTKNLENIVKNFSIIFLEFRKFGKSKLDLDLDLEIIA